MENGNKTINERSELWTHLYWLREAKIKHGRLEMIAVAGIRIMTDSGSCGIQTSSTLALGFS